MVVAVEVPNVAVNVISVSAETPTVVMLKVAVVEPAGTVTDVGRVAAVLVDERLTTSPLGPAALEIVTVPVEVNPPYPVPGETTRLFTVAALIVNVAVFVVPCEVAVMTADVEVETAAVVTVNVALVEPDATVTDAGTVAFVLLDERLITRPLAPAGAASNTVPVELLPPVTDVGFKVSPDSPSGFTVRVAVCEPPA